MKVVLLILVGFVRFFRLAFRRRRDKIGVTARTRTIDTNRGSIVAEIHQVDVAGKHRGITQGITILEVAPSKALQAISKRKSARAKGFGFDSIHAATQADDTSANNELPAG